MQRVEVVLSRSGKRGFSRKTQTRFSMQTEYQIVKLSDIS